MVAGLGCTALDEKSASADSVLTLGNVVVLLHDGIKTVNFRDVPYYHQDVNDWFGRHAGYGSAANVMDFDQFPYKNCF